MSKAQATKAQESTASENREQPVPTKIGVKISSIRPEGSIKAIASLNLNGCFAVRNVKVMNGEKGLFVSMPGYKNGKGEFRDICFPVTKEFREQINEAVIHAYNQALAQGQKAAETHPFEAPEQQHSGMQMGM